MRKLASIQKITDITPIKGADAIETAWIGGWPTVIKKNEYKVGDLAVYLEIDSWVPYDLAPFLSKGKEPREYNGVKGERLRTVRLRGQLSQGLLLPISVCIDKCGCTSAITEGMDVSEWLNIQKWEAPLPACLAGQAEGIFPSFIRKTDQPRCQNIVREIFGYDTIVTPLDISVEQAAEGIASGRLIVEDGKVMAVHPPEADPNTEYECTIKMDGSSMTAFVFKSALEDGARTGVCSRNLQLMVNEENSENTFVKMFVTSGLKQFLLNYYVETNRSIAVQGELMGEGIQGNRENIKGHQLFIFAVFDIDKQQYWSPAERRELAKRISAECSMIDHVPVLHENVKLQDIGITNVQEALKFAEGKSLVNPVREGVVFARTDGQFSFKAISNLYLLNEA